MDNHTNFMCSNQVDPYQYSLLGDDIFTNFDSFSCEGYKTISPQINLIPNHEVLPIAIKNSISSSPSSSHLISFVNSNPKAKRKLESGASFHHVNIFNPSIDCQTQIFLTNYKQGVAKKDGLYCHEEHVLAERKRREKMSQLFTALSAVIPGLKKMDKVTVLGDAIKYVKQLEDRVKMLEQEMSHTTVESVFYVKRSQPISTVDLISDDQTISLPEIEARVSGKDVLIRIHSEKRRMMGLSEIVTAVEKLRLSIVNTNVLPLGSSIIHVTIVAKMDDEFCMEVKDLTKNLREALLSYSII